MDLLFWFFYYHVINVNHQFVSYFLWEHRVYRPLIGGTNVLKPKRHDFVIIVTWLDMNVVFGAYMGLILEGIHETQHFITWRSVKKAIYVGKEIYIFFTCNIEVNEITHVWHLFDAFLTKTILANHKGYLISIMKVTLVSLWTSLSMNDIFSLPMLPFLWDIGMTMAMRWHITLVYMSDMCEGVQAYKLCFSSVGWSNPLL